MQNYSNTINTSDNLHKYFNNGFSNFQEFQNDVFEKLDHFKYKSLRKLVFSNYIIIYEIQKDPR